MYAVAEVNFVFSLSPLHNTHNTHIQTHTHIYTCITSKYSSTCGEADSTLDDAEMEMMQMISGMEGRENLRMKKMLLLILSASPFILFYFSLSLLFRIALFKIDLK